MQKTVFLIPALIILVFGTCATAADLPVTPKAREAPNERGPAALPAAKPGGPNPVSNPNLNPYSPEDPSCRTWTDGCRHCQRDSADNVQCSNIGIACQPGPVVCQ